MSGHKIVVFSSSYFVFCILTELVLNALVQGYVTRTVYQCHRLLKVCLNCVRFSCFVIMFVNKLFLLLKS